MNKNDWITVMDAFRILAPALAGYAVHLLRGILKELQDLNKRVQAVEHWEQAHDKMDDERFDDVQREIDYLRRSLTKGS